MGPKVPMITAARVERQLHYLATVDRIVAVDKHQVHK
jgi:hypothetical protein